MIKKIVIDALHKLFDSEVSNSPMQLLQAIAMDASPNSQAANVANDIVPSESKVANTATARETTVRSLAFLTH